MFDISLSLASSAEFNLCFSFQESPHRLSVALEAQSTLAIHVPWVTTASGSTSGLTGQLVGVSVCSSLPYPPLGRAADITFQVDLHFPRLWNAVQKWQMKFSGKSVQANILFAYIDYVNGRCMFCVSLPALSCHSTCSLAG